MKHHLKVIWSITSIGIALLLLTACLPTSVEPTAELTIPTAISPLEPQETDSPPVIAPTLRADLPAPPTFQPGDSSSAQPIIQSTPQPDSTSDYLVTFVVSDDTLNVRSGPGVENEVVGELPPDTTRTEITGSGQLVDGSTWVPIEVDGVTGWVNGRFLTQAVAPDAFCQDDAVLNMMTELETAVTNQDGDLMAQLIHPERGLRLRHTWWNPEVLLTSTEVSQIFTSPTSYDWGVEDGSGNPIVGSFKQETLPLLQEDFLLATETACDEILHGGTAGIVQLPDEYQQIHYYSLYRPGTDEFAGMNWGTWVVGVERWQGQYYLSFLVHFAWEI